MSERERFERWFNGDANVRMSDLPEHEAWYIWQARARIAEQREDVLEEALETTAQFIINGIDLGYILMPNINNPDSVRLTPAIVRNIRAIRAILDNHNDPDPSDG